MSLVGCLNTYISTATLASRRDQSRSQGYDLAYGAINHASALMKAVIVDKHGYLNTSIIQ